MKSTGEAIYYQGPEGGACPALDARFFRQVYGERSMYLSR
jgi:hypothetical protein